MTVNDPLEGLSEQERFACLVAEHVLGASARAWDVNGRQGAVDAILTLRDGREAAFEVTSVSAPGALQTSSLLGRDYFSWPCPGAWWWTVQVGDVRDLPRLREVFADVALRCEAYGVARPEELRWDHHDRHPDVRWLVEDSTSAMFGHPGIPAPREGAMVVPAGRGGGVDETLEGLRDALVEVFAEPHMARRIAKLAMSGREERHLFIAAHWTAFPFSVAEGFWTGHTLPPEPPPLPAGVTHLWLTGMGQRVLLGQIGIWHQEWLPDIPSRTASLTTSTTPEPRQATELGSRGYRVWDGPATSF